MSDTPPAKIDDEEILLLMLDRDEEGVRLLLHAYGPIIKGVLRCRLKKTLLDDDDFDDAIMMAAFKINAHPEKFDRKKGNLDQLFYRVAEREAQNILRRDSKHYPISSLDEMYETEGWEPSDPDRPGEAKLSPRDTKLCQAARQYIEEKLPGKMRDILISDLFTDGCVSDDELAERLGSPKTTIQTLRCRAKKLVRDEMKRLGLWNQS